MSEQRAGCYGRDLDADGWPSVAVVLPVRNEADHLESAIGSILDQDYPQPLKIALGVAPSDDDTEAIAARLAANDPRIAVVNNPRGLTPAGLNAAIGATTSDVIVRVDGHAKLSAGYIRRAVETMVETGAVNVGGCQVPDPDTPFEHAVAAVTTSRLGTGGASYRVGGVAGPVDTVYLGVFDRAAGDAVGWFDESLVRNQDYELNIRLRDGGGTIWFDPQLSVSYRPRSSVEALARQYFEYGWWKAEVISRRPSSLRLRQLLPAALIPVLGGALLLRPRLGRAALTAYLGLCAGEAARQSGGRWHQRLLATLTIHLSWGTGFWSRALSAVVQRWR